LWSISGGNYSGLGLIPFYPFETGKYASINWNKMEEWKNIVTGQFGQLQFPPLIPPKIYGNEVIVLYLKRDFNDLLIYGGYHENALKCLPQQDITLSVNIKIQKKDKTILNFDMKENVTIDHKRKCGYSSLCKKECDWWTDIDESILPEVEVSILPLQLSESLVMFSRAA
jgi:hypothetical protein